jgi:hypothetical protein
MPVGDEDRIDFRQRHRGLAQTLTAGFARIDQHRGSAGAQKNRGAKSSAHRRAGARAEEEERIHGRFFSFRHRPAQAVALARRRMAL